MRILGAVCASILAASLGTLAACGGTPDSKEPTTAQAVSAASVSIALFDENGTRVGEGSGVMIAPRLVLTSGHLISGKHKWVVTSADGKQQATGSRGMTYDWMKYDSDKAHPRRHDIGVIHLDASIKLTAYPKLVSERSPSGSKATRLRGTGAGFQQHDATLEKVRSSPNAWLADGQAGETLDTGGAVYDSRGILGIVSGRGMTTGKLYIARVDGLVKWLAPKVACAGGATGVRTYAGPAVDKSKEICEDAGAGTGGEDGENASSGGPGGGSPGDDNGGSCDGNNDGVCSGECGAGGTDGTGGSDGSSGPGSDGSNGPGDGTGGGAPGTDGDSNGGTNNSSGPGGDNAGGAPGSEGNGGNDGSNSNGNTNNSASPPGGGGAGSSDGTVPGSDNDGDESEACQGPNDNPDVCPPEPDGCVGPKCGGGKPDESIDYGSCACGSSKSGGNIYLR
ncbi:MAG: hypothetical protein KF764_02330 [Labilithrix sp.]|nr:hypothetical protein [Labilithrix sp.]MBX3224935.1 hypothetical protein [Labilithrix sp.]